MSSSSISPNIVKTIAAAGIAAAIDKFYFMEQNMQKTMYFAASTAAATYVSGMVEDANILPVIIPDMGTYANGIQIEDRILEILLMGGATVAVDKYVLKNPTARGEVMKIFAAAAVTDLIAESIVDYMAGRAINPFLSK